MGFHYPSVIDGVTEGWGSSTHSVVFGLMAKTFSKPHFNAN